MTETIWIEAKRVPPALRYNGTKCRVVLCESVTIPSYAGNWDGGSRSTYRIVRIADGATLPGSDNSSAPWDRTRADRRIVLEPGIAVIEHRIFQGRDMGLTIHALAADVAPMLPAPVALSPIERAVLEYTASRKSSYNGRDRFQMCCNDMQDAIRYGYRVPSHGLASVPTRAMWDAAKVELAARGLLTKAGAITVAGRNANSGAV